MPFWTPWSQTGPVGSQPVRPCWRWSWAPDSCSDSGSDMAALIQMLAGWGQALGCGAGVPMVAELHGSILHCPSLGPGWAGWVPALPCPLSGPLGCWRVSQAGPQVGLKLEGYLPLSSEVREKRLALC